MTDEYPIVRRLREAVDCLQCDETGMAAAETIKSLARALEHIADLDTNADMCNGLEEGPCARAARDALKKLRGEP